MITLSSTTDFCLCSRFKLLETKLESTLKSSLEIKEEKIAALEARLQESSNLNQQLRQELKTVSITFSVFWRMQTSRPPVKDRTPTSQLVLWRTTCPDLFQNTKSDADYLFLHSSISVKSSVSSHET